jgi:hypothetical protein
MFKDDSVLLNQLATGYFKLLNPDRVSTVGSSVNFYGWNIKIKKSTSDVYAKLMLLILKEKFEEYGMEFPYPNLNLTPSSHVIGTNRDLSSPLRRIFRDQEDYNNLISWLRLEGHIKSERQWNGSSALKSEPLALRDPLLRHASLIVSMKKEVGKAINNHFNLGLVDRSLTNSPKSINPLVKKFDVEFKNLFPENS